MSFDPVLFLFLHFALTAIWSRMPQTLEAAVAMSALILGFCFLLWLLVWGTETEERSR